MSASALPVQVLLGLYLGLLTGIVPALVAWGMGFLFKYFTGVTIPGFGVVALSLAIAGVNGGLLALTDDTVASSANETALVVGIVVILMLSLYAHARGDAMGASLPRRVSFRALTDRTINADVVELVAGRGRVRVTVTGDVADLEGYPALPAELRASLREYSDTFPAELPLGELESAVAARLRTEFDLADASVRLDERGRATVAAAPPVGSVSGRIPASERAVSVEGLVPTGLARGDEVSVVTDGGEYRGTVVAARSTPDASSLVPGQSTEPDASTDGGTDESAAEATPAPTSPTTTGGVGRVTVALDRAAAAAVLGDGFRRLVVRSRGTRREFELVSLLRGAGSEFRRLRLREGGALDGRSLGETTVRDGYGVAVLAVRSADGWAVTPGGTVRVVAGDELVVVGTRGNLDRFEAEVAA